VLEGDLRLGHDPIVRAIPWEPGRSQLRGRMVPGATTMGR
jgi:hypothetical protein